MCTNSHVLERIERYFKALKNYKKDVEKAVRDVERGKPVNLAGLSKYIETFNGVEMEKVMDYVGVFKKDPKRELAEPLAASLELLGKFIATGDPTIGRRLLEEVRKINV